MDIHKRKLWNENHKKLTNIIHKTEEHEQTLRLFLSQHALLHSSSITNTNQITLEDSVFDNLDESIFRAYPVANPDTKNSIAWHIWHISRIEDMTMNILVANGQQVLNEGRWLEKLQIDVPHSGNDMSESEIADVSSKISFHSLLSYRAAVGRQTRQVITSLEAGQFKMKVDSMRIQRLMDENAVSQSSKWLAEYWSKKTVGGLILMPATRHNFLHLNKCNRIKERLHKKAFTTK
ncbi:DinB family protein [Fredinandcohnia sp. 179-A 10B2 NHS]|uniref:DinB family protein n=1 Tax=Fredinandcohnia sp. 179-A 10B2 NHS TaxID=3235176 RepID=UPI0039A03049